MLPESGVENSKLKIFDKWLISIDRVTNVSLTDTYNKCPISTNKSYSKTYTKVTNYTMTIIDYTDIYKVICTQTNARCLTGHIIDNNNEHNATRQ